MVGVWDVRQGNRRVGELGSGGTGPHDIRLVPGGDALVVANGGLATHPEAGRTRLKIPTMRLDLTYLDLESRVLDGLELARAHQRNSIRHLSVARDGSVAFAMQWQGDVTEGLPLLRGHHGDRKTLTLLEEASMHRMNGYLGSIAIAEDASEIAMTSPRSGMVQMFRLGSPNGLSPMSAASQRPEGFVVTTGNGVAGPLSGPLSAHAMAWDIHLVAIRAGVRRVRPL